MEIVIIRKKLISMSIISTFLTVRGQPLPRFHMWKLGYLSGTVKWTINEYLPGYLQRLSKVRVDNSNGCSSSSGNDSSNDNEYISGCDNGTDDNDNDKANDNDKDNDYVTGNGKKNISYLKV